YVELTDREPPVRVAAAHQRVQTLAYRGDHFVRDRKPVRLVDAAEMVDCEEKETARRAQAGGFIESDLQRLEQLDAVYLAGQSVELRQVGEPLLARVAFIDDAHDAVGTGRPAVGAGEPSPDILDPELSGV